MKIKAGFSSDDAKLLIADTLRLYVGRGRRLSWEDLAEATEIKEGTLRSYVAEGGPEMPLHVMLTVFPLLPPAAFARLARAIGFSATLCEVDDEATVRRALAQGARLVADGNEFLEDGILSPSERARLAARASELMPTLQAIAGNATH
jgi:hypothetical protein